MSTEKSSILELVHRLPKLDLKVKVVTVEEVALVAQVVEFLLMVLRLKQLIVVRAVLGKALRIKYTLHMAKTLQTIIKPRIHHTSSQRISGEAKKANKHQKNPLILKYLLTMLRRIQITLLPVICPINTNPIIKSLAIHRQQLRNRLIRVVLLNRAVTKPQ